MVVSKLKTTQDIHGFTSLHININLSRSFKYSIRGFKIVFLLSDFAYMQIGAFVSP